MGFSPLAFPKRVVTRKTWEENFREVYQLVQSGKSVEPVNAVKFPVRLDAAIDSNNAAAIVGLTWSPDEKILASNGIKVEKAPGAREAKVVRQLLFWDAENWDKEPKVRITPGKFALFKPVFFDPNDSTRLAFHSTDGYGILNLKRPKDKPRLIKKKHFMRRVGAIGAQGTNWSRDGKKIAFNLGKISWTS